MHIPHTASTRARARALTTHTTHTQATAWSELLRWQHGDGVYAQTRLWRSACLLVGGSRGRMMTPTCPIAAHAHRLFDAACLNDQRCMCLIAPYAPLLRISCPVYVKSETQKSGQISKYIFIRNRSKLYFFLLFHNRTTPPDGRPPKGHIGPLFGLVGSDVKIRI